MRNLYHHDPRLLVVFIALMEERNVSRAAEKLNLSQPAISHALTRLRDEFKDDLFVRSAKGVTPTRRALQLRPTVQSLVNQMQELYLDSKPFDLKSANNRITISTTDFFEALVLPKLLPILKSEAPHIQIVTRPNTGCLPKDEMEQGVIDLGVAGYFGALPEGFYQQRLMQEDYVCILRNDHPNIKKKLTLDAYLGLDHILVSPQGDLQGAVDKALAKTKQSRRIVAGVSNFHLPAILVSESNCIATMPSRMAKQLVNHYPISILPPPLDLPGFKIIQVWHARTNNDPAQVWIRRKVSEIFDKI